MEGIKVRFAADDGLLTLSTLSAVPGRGDFVVFQAGSTRQCVQYVVRTITHFIGTADAVPILIQLDAVS